MESLCARGTKLEGRRACTRRYCIGKDQSNCSVEGKKTPSKDLLQSCNRMYAAREEKRHMAD